MNKLPILCSYVVELAEIFILTISFNKNIHSELSYLSARMITRPMNSLHDTDAWIWEDSLVRIESLWQSSRRQTQKHKNLIF
uniref:Uncharacterized protein n=1 Tax=Caenorhabditis japonica TaxID=281687 RepID=A0A8R1ILK0_CAEJA